jgi:site-specific recombinase XerD
MLFKEAHNKFLNYLEVIKNKSPRTVEQYDRHLKKFNEYIKEKIKNNENFKVEDISLDIAE